MTQDLKMKDYSMPSKFLSSPWLSKTLKMTAPKANDVVLIYKAAFDTEEVCVCSTLTPKQSTSFLSCSLQSSKLLPQPFLLLTVIDFAIANSVLAEDSDNALPLPFLH
ncbi:hypothetical protein VNO78_23910 [Psophocarpus tetragonolobus]|uniref:Uncharacterized protein n=1 Tax=Psophocarpus tetragonolobus TaxID=3891 RepID=A0AAN9S4H0_PSOTE